MEDLTLIADGHEDAKTASEEPSCSKGVLGLGNPWDDDLDIDPSDFPEPAPPKRRDVDEHGPGGAVELLADLRGLVHAFTDLLRAALINVGHQGSSSSDTAYSSVNLPPGASARAFSAAIRKGLVESSQVGNRIFVSRAAWDAYVVNQTKKPSKVRRNASDDELLAQVATRRRRTG